MIAKRNKLLLGAVLPVLAAAQDVTVLETTVLILGGGMTGVAAANSLALDYNITSFLVLEARHELGGRVQTTSLGNYTVEKGANWIEGLGTNPIWALAQKYDVENTYSNWSSLDYFTEERGWEDEDGPLSEAVTEYEEEAFFKAAADAGRRKELGLTDLSMKAGLDLSGWIAQTPEEKAAEYFSHDWEYAEPPIESSMIGTVEAYNSTFEDFGNGDTNFVTDQQGYAQVVKEHMNEVPGAAEKILYNQTVEKIEYTADGVTVTTKEGLTIHAKYALCTFSVGVLQHDDVQFEPAFPDWKNDAIANFHLATYMKIFAQFPTKFWNDTEFALFAHSDTRGHYAVWQSLDVPGFFPGSGIFFATLTGDRAYRAEAQTDDEVKADFMDVLTTMYGEDVPEPLDFVVPRWTLDPLFRGTFTNWGTGVTVKQQDDLRAAVGGESVVERTLHFAGEHTSRYYFGYLHGAYFEGKSAASRLADCVLNECEDSSTSTRIRRDAANLQKRAMKVHRKRQWGGRG